MKILIKVKGGNILTRKGVFSIPSMEKIIALKESFEARDLKALIRGEIDLEIKRLQGRFGFWEIIPDRYHEDLEGISVPIWGRNGGKCQISAVLIPDGISSW